MAAATNTNTRALFTCGKCDGAGSLTWTNQDNGVCYWCKGAGKVPAQDPGIIKRAMASAAYAANTAAQGMLRGAGDYARSYARSAAVDLMKVGTENARAVLDGVLRGLVFDCYDMDESDAHGRAQLTQAQAVALRALIIAEGRKLAA
jgi:hypothetical protein